MNVTRESDNFCPRVSDFNCTEGVKCVWLSFQSLRMFAMALWPSVLFVDGEPASGRMGRKSKCRWSFDYSGHVRIHMVAFSASRSRRLRRQGSLTEVPASSSLTVCNAQTFEYPLFLPPSSTSITDDTSFFSPPISTGARFTCLHDMPLPLAYISLKNRREVPTNSHRL